MPPSELQKRSLLFVFATAAISAALVFLPFAEAVFKGFVLGQLGMAVSPTGDITSVDGESHSMLATTIAEAALILLQIFKIVLWMALVVTIVRFISFLVMKTALRGAGQSEIASLARTVISIVIYIVAFFVIFQSFYPNVELAPLFTGSTIIGIVVGLALQDTLGNLFSGIALQADQPFHVGDVVSFENGKVGVVESVTWRGVKIRNFQNRLIVMSNAVLGKEAIEVAAKDNLNARLVFFNTLYSNSPAKTAQVVREAVRFVENVSAKKRPIVRIRNLGDNGIDWEIKYWLEDYARYNETDAVIRERVWYAFKRENIDFAYPTRTIYMEEAAAEPSIEDHLESTAERLSRIPIFEPLSDEELMRLAKASQDRTFAPGEAIVRRGREGNSMFVVTSGRVDVQVLQGGDLKTINTLGVNDYFGEMSLLTGEPRTATVIAIEETEVLQISKLALKPIFDANPDLVRSISEMIEERRVLLLADEPSTSAAEQRKEKGVLSSIKNFFGIR